MVTYARLGPGCFHTIYNSQLEGDALVSMLEVFEYCLCINLSLIMIF